ncbi:hypothetical protein Tco_0161750 [Tanacetum coccineum]
MVPPNKLGPDLSGKTVNETQYRGMIGSLMYLTASRPDIQFSTCLCARYQANPMESYLIAIRRIFRYLKGTPNLGKSPQVLMKSQLTDYDIIYEKVPIFYDNTSDIAISNNLVLHSRTKHIDIKDHILKGDIELHFIPTQYQLADIFTKPLDEPTFKRLIVELGGIRGDIGINTFRNALRAHYLPHSSMYVSTPSITIVRPWFATIGYSGEIRAKETLKNSCLPPRWRLLMDYARLIWEDIIHKLSKKTREKVVPNPRFISLLLEYMMLEYDNEELTINPAQVFSVHNWALKPNQTEGPPFTDHMKAICKKPRAKIGLKRKQSSKHTSESKTEAYKSKIGQSKKETQSSSAKNKILSHPLPPTPVVGEMHKEAQQAAGGLTSLGATSEDGAHPQLISDSIAEADPKLSAPNDSIPSQQDLLKDTRSAFFTLDSPQDEPIIVLAESEEEEEVSKDKDTYASSHDVLEKDELEQQKAKAEAEVTSLKARPSYLDINQLTNLLVTSLKPKFSKLLASHDFASCLLNALKELPSKFTELSGEIKELKKHVQDMEIELPGDLKEFPTKLETSTSTISSLSSQVVELKNIQSKHPEKFQALPSQVSLVQEKLKTLDSLPSLLNKVTDTLNWFSTVVENASRGTTKDVPSAGQATASPTEGEKNTTKDAETNLQNELVDLLGIDVVEQYHNKK